MRHGALSSPLVCVTNRTLICDILHFTLPTRWNTHNDGECGTGWRVYLASHRHLRASGSPALVHRLTSPPLFLLTIFFRSDRAKTYQSTCFLTVYNRAEFLS
ncbi:hypothetical protein EXIGLDRAFT_847848 [Exidia glandulosa HHB12029]|uniref:Uncharacterized protein n=1 Tax=Exidia glandulosa HHB12029 TaxID=1314781 RepID=A0A166MH62_EXIGL|nr:hypothetical protein EXIGLDRAFT_847848 [Exidia glandulosa HHB12029]